MDNKSLDTKKEPDFYIGISRDEAKIISIGKTVNGMSEIEIDLNDETNQDELKLGKAINSIMNPAPAAEAPESPSALEPSESSSALVTASETSESSSTLVPDTAYVRFNNALKPNRNFAMGNRLPTPQAVGNVLKNSTNVLESAVVPTIGGAKHKRTKRRKSKRRKTKRRKTKRSK